MVEIKDKRSFAMPYHTYPYETKPLAFAYDALEPYIDAETMHYHHDKHYQKYVDQLNNALKPYPNLQQLTLEQLLTRTDEIPNAIYDAVMHNGGGVYNHMLFFDGLAPADTGRHMPQGRLAANIARTFSSFEEFKQRFNAHAAAVFGSGWTCLAAAPSGALEIISLPNQDTFIASGHRVVMLIDVWEHACYLKYKNERDKYIEAFWNVVTFPQPEPK